MEQTNLLRYRLCVGRQQRGLSLIEVLIAVLVLSVGLLGLAGMNMAGIRNNHNAYMRSQATFMASDMLDRMRINRTEAIVEETYDRNLGDSSPAVEDLDDADFSPSMAAQDVNAWLTTLSSVLPSGDGSIDCNPATEQCSVTVRWSERLGRGEGGEARTVDFIVRARL